MEELFFFTYHMRMSKHEAWSLPIHERKWLIRRFVDQKKKENDQITKVKRKK